MPLASRLLVILGLATLAAASLPLWPPSLGLHPPTAGEAAMLAALGLGSLAMAGYFSQLHRRDLHRQAAAARASILAGQLVGLGVIADFVESTQVGCLRLTATPDDGASDPYASTFGGVFYSPPGFAWPLTAHQQPMWPLAQLNFAELPRLDGFPDRGILQLFIDGDDMYGADLDDPITQSGFRVVYHAEVGPLTFPNPVQPNPDEAHLPFEGTFRLTATATTMPMTVSDWRFDQAIADSWRRRMESEPEPELVRAARQLLLDEDEIDEVTFGSHQIGGYPWFTQEDPREYSDALDGHTALLLQIDSSLGIDWGDAGIANFLIEPDRLRRRDFSRVAYTWDCH